MTSGFQNTLALTASGMEAQAMRLRYISENIANQDTPGYHRKTVAFRAELDSGHPTGRVTPGKVEGPNISFTHLRSGKSAC